MLTTDKKEVMVLEGKLVMFQEEKEKINPGYSETSVHNSLDNISCLSNWMGDISDRLKEYNVSYTNDDIEEYRSQLRVVLKDYKAEYESLKEDKSILKATIEQQEYQGPDHKFDIADEYFKVVDRLDELDVYIQDVKLRIDALTYLLSDRAEPLGFFDGSFRSLEEQAGDLY